MTSLVDASCRIGASIGPLFHPVKTGQLWLTGRGRPPYSHSESPTDGRARRMGLSFTKLNPIFVAEVSSVDLRKADEDTLAEIRGGMDTYAVLVFRNQPFTDAQQLDFAQRLDGVLHTKLGISALQKNRFGNEALGDIS